MMTQNPLTHQVGSAHHTMAPIKSLSNAALNVPSLVFNPKNIEHWHTNHLGFDIPDQAACRDAWERATPILEDIAERLGNVFDAVDPSALDGTQQLVGH